MSAFFLSYVNLFGTLCNPPLIHMSPLPRSTWHPPLDQKVPTPWGKRYPPLGSKGTQPWGQKVPNPWVKRYPPMRSNGTTPCGQKVPHLWSNKTTSQGPIPHQPVYDCPNSWTLFRTYSDQGMTQAPRNKTQTTENDFFDHR